jgi:hypothetical protein
MSDTEIVQVAASPLDAYSNHPLFQHVIRNRVEARLRRQHGFSRKQAADAVDDLDNKTVALAAMEVGAEPPPPSKGGFFDWLQKNLPQILQIVSIIVSLITAVA